MARDEAKADGQQPGEADSHEAHELPRGALVMTLAFLVLITVLWIQIYVMLLTSGGIPR